MESTYHAYTAPTEVKTLAPQRHIPAWADLSGRNAIFHFPVRAFFRNFAQSQYGGQHPDRPTKNNIPHGQGDREEIYGHQRQL